MRPQRTKCSHPARLTHGISCIPGVSCLTIRYAVIPECVCVCVEELRENGEHPQQ